MRHRLAGRATLPPDLVPERYLIAVAILDRQGGLMPIARFAIENYRRRGWRKISRSVEFSLTDERQEKSFEFEIKTSFEDETTLRFRLPREVAGTSDLAKSPSKPGQ